MHIHNTFLHKGYELSRTPKQGQSSRANTGERIHYDPEWSASKPFCYFDAKGTAGRQFETKSDAVRYVEDWSKNVRWTEWH